MRSKHEGLIPFDIVAVVNLALFIFDETIIRFCYPGPEVTARKPPC